MGSKTRRKARQQREREVSDSRRLQIHLQGVQRAEHARNNPTVMRAAGIKIERMSAERLRAVAGQQQAWQKLAWGYRDMIGELRGALQFRARNISRARFYIAQVEDDDDEPIPVALRHERDGDGKPTERAQAITLPEDLCVAAERELARLPLDSGYNFLGVWSENFDVAGECWLHGIGDPETGEETWTIRSIKDVLVQGDTVAIRDELGQPRPVDLSPDSGEELYRLWVPHPASPHLADSALNACMDSLEDVALTGREMRAAARSRIAANGLLKVPNGLVQTRNQKEDTEITPEERFQADLTAAFLAPISNEGEPGAVVPMMVFGTLEDLAGLEHMTFEREDSPTLIEKQKNALGRMANSIDTPPEIITGMADVNHWTAWQIDASTFRNYLEPGMRLMVDSLTVCFLRAALRGGFRPEDLKRVRIWYDAGSITENPNRRQDALDAFDRGGIGPRTLRAELGYNDGDEPSTEELLLMIALKQGFDQAAAAKVLAWLAQQEGLDLPDIASTPQVAGQVPGQRPALEPSQATPDPTGVGGTGAPEGESPDGVAASALVQYWQKPAYPETAFADTQGSSQSESDIPKWRLDTATGARLADIERALMEQILLAADQAVNAALKRAGSRLRSKAQRDPELTASLRSRPVVEWAMVMGREQAFALGADLRFLLREAFDDLSGKFATWVNGAIDKLIGRILAFLKIKPGSPEGRAARDRMRTDMGARTGEAWTNLHQALLERTGRLLFDGEGEPLADGETAAVVVPPWMVRNALAEVGGMPETAGGFNARGNVPTGEPTTGLADGATITRELATHGVVTLGREWRYNPTLVRNTFEPHLELDGVRFTSWSDEALRTDITHAWIGTHYRPGDHDGCLCTAIPAYAIPQDPAPIPPGQEQATAQNERDWNQALADQFRERLRQPSQDMAYTIELAEADDREGRRNTVAQQTRDQWLEVQRLKTAFLNGE